MAEKEKKQKLPFRFVPTRHVIENSKKIAKQFKKLKNTITASFHAKIGWKRLRNIENKNYRSVPPRPVREHSIKIAKKFKKLKITNMA